MINEENVSLRSASCSSKLIGPKEEGLETPNLQLAGQKRRRIAGHPAGAEDSLLDMRDRPLPQTTELGSKSNGATLVRQNSRQTSPSNRTEPKDRPAEMQLTILAEDTEATPGGNESVLSQWGPTTEQPRANADPDTDLTPLPIHSQRVTDLNGECKTGKLLEKSSGDHLDDPRSGDDFSEHQKGTTHERNSDRLDCLKTEDFGETQYPQHEKTGRRKFCKRYV